MNMNFKTLFYGTLIVVTFLGTLSCVGLILGELFGVWPKHEYWPWVYLVWGYGCAYGFISGVKDLRETIYADRGPGWEI